MACDVMGWDGMGWDEMGWDGIACMLWYCMACYKNKNKNNFISEINDVSRSNINFLS